MSAASVSNLHSSAGLASAAQEREGGAGEPATVLVVARRHEELAALASMLDPERAPASRSLDADWALLVAASAADAIRVLAEHDVAAVVVDAGLSAEIAGVAKSALSARHVPVVLAGAERGDAESLARAYAGGVTDHLDAPVLPQVLRSKVAALVEQHQERRRAVGALRRELDRERRRRGLLVDALPALVWTARADGAADGVSGRWTEYTGIDAEGARGDGWLAAVHPDERARTAERWREAVRAGVACESELRLRRAVDGAYRRHLCRAVPERSATGAIAGYIAVLTDVEAERELGDRCARLAREAELANRAKDDFLVTLSHELRTPLTAVLGWVRLLRGGRIDAAAAARGIETIERNAQLQAQLVEEILDVSRAVAGRLTLELQPIGAYDAIRAAVDEARPAAAAKGVVVTERLDPGTGLVAADPGRLRQIVKALLSNALKFTPPGGAVAIALDRNRDTVRLRIEDSGAGIDPGFLPHVFDRFRQEEAGLTRAHGGLGLGLALARALVELHRGEIRAESAGKGRGTTVTVLLPLGAPRDAETAAARDAARAGATNR